MSDKACQVFKKFYAVMVSSAQLQNPRVLQVFKEVPRDNVVSQLIAEHVVGKSEPSPHLYGDKPKIHVVPVHIPVDILYK